MQYKDYYKILGVSRDSSDEDIKRAYRKLARKYHPDVSKESNAEEHFKDVQEAYEALKDPQKRAAPHWQGFAGFNGEGGEQVDMGDFSDFFANLFGGGHRGGFRTAREMHRPGRDEHAKIAISLEEAFHGGEKTIQLQEADGSIRTLKINIPAGIVSGQQLRLAQQGSKGVGKAPAGDLYLEIEILPNKNFTLQGKDVYLTLPITPWEAALGAKLTIPTLGGPVDMKIAPAAQSGQKLRLKGRGLPAKPTSGDQYVLLQIVTPPAHTPEARALYEKMAKELPYDPRKGLF
jgi:curved DNA-binding protein